MACALLVAGCARSPHSANTPLSMTALDSDAEEGIEHDADGAAVASMTPPLWQLTPEPWHMRFHLRLDALRTSPDWPALRRVLPLLQSGISPETLSALLDRTDEMVVAQVAAASPTPDSVLLVRGMPLVDCQVLLPQGVAVASETGLPTVAAGGLQCAQLLPDTAVIAPPSAVEATAQWVRNHETATPTSPNDSDGLSNDAERLCVAEGDVAGTWCWRPMGNGDVAVAPLRIPFVPRLDLSRMTEARFALNVTAGVRLSGAATFAEPQAASRALQVLHDELARWMRQPVVGVFGLRWMFERWHQALSAADTQLRIDWYIAPEEVPDWIHVIEPLLQIQQLMMMAK
ncbi:MAG: hypothetical protein M0R76_03930 [Proteobacteria bacterium]|nr:hypothetical protein [Pseudomonadota bacterium]